MGTSDILDSGESENDYFNVYEPMEPEGCKPKVNAFDPETYYALITAELGLQ
jgi:hypothetical protein